jgi:Family of unknown function (DUF6220)
MQTLISTLPEATQPGTTTGTPVQQQTITAIPGRAAKTHTLIARILLGGVALQIFFAGLGVFGVSSFLPHMILGPLVILGSLALPLVAWRAHLGAALHRRSWLVFGLMIFQGLLIDAGRLIPLVAAFHPVNAMLLVLLVASMARITRDR